MIYLLLAIGFFKRSTHGNIQLLNAWASCNTIIERLTPNVTPTYKGYFDFLMSHAKELEDSVANNSLSCRENVAESDYMQPYSPSDECYDVATDLSTYVRNRGVDINMIQDILNCGKALQQGKPIPQKQI